MAHRCREKPTKNIPRMARNLMRSFIKSLMMTVQGPNRWWNVKKLRNSTKHNSSATARNWFRMYKQTNIECLSGRKKAITWVPIPIEPTVMMITFMKPKPSLSFGFVASETHNPINQMSSNHSWGLGNRLWSTAFARGNQGLTMVNVRRMIKKEC